MPRFTLVASVLGAAAAFVPAAARAHFILQSPASWAQQDPTGMPEKSAPCGQADPGTTAVATNNVTGFAPGDTVTITVNEAIFHPGHYRVALSSSGQDGLPADPPVTAGSTACGSTVIQSPAVFPVLADGMLQHTTAFSGPQSFTVKLPTDIICTRCSLQVIEFMSDHGLNNPGGCFYHHCADLSIEPGGGSGNGGSTGNASGTGGSSSGGGGCAVAGARVSLTTGLVLLVAAGVMRRRRRRR
jgi:uncharacterized membrane protein YgcG